MRTRMFSRSVSVVALAAGIATAGVIPLHAAVSIVDLSFAGASGTANGGFFQQVPDQSTGTGVIEPFLRIQQNGGESGFNTSLNDPMPDVKTGTWTHDILLSAIPKVTLSGVEYYQFLLDINQSASNALLSLNDLQIFLRTGAFSGAGSANEYSDLTNIATGATKVWDLDAITDTTIELNYALNPGSGAGDMFAYLPVSMIGTDGTKNLYLYSAFGDPNSSNDGFEEWAVVRGPPVTTPDGGTTAILLGGALLGLAFIQRRLFC